MQVRHHAARLAVGTLLLTVGWSAQSATLTFDPETSAVEAGAALRATVTLSSPAKTNVVVPIVSSNPPVAAVPASVTVPAGAAKAQFVIQIARQPVAAAVAIQVTVSPPTESLQLNRKFTVLPPAAIASVATSPATVVGGAQSVLTVTLSRQAVYPGVVVGLSNTSTGQVVQPASVTVPAGKMVVSTNVNTAPVSALITVQVAAAVAGANRVASTLTVSSAPVAPPALACSVSADCVSGLCVDGVCCSSACGGSCQACNLAGSEGSCTPIPAGADPALECGAVSCAGYYWGWSGGTCYRRADVSASASMCDGANACQSTASACAASVQGPVTLTCSPTSQAPTPGTCMGTTPGSCTNH
jgi:hypothetical protein